MQIRDSQASAEIKSWRGLHVEQAFMIEVFAGAAVLCSAAKQFGLKNTIAVDKVRKRNARSTIYQLDLLQERDKWRLEQWMLSGLLLWVHLAPECGTASRAPDIRRSEDWPEGLPNLHPKDRERVDLANRLFSAACWHVRRVCW